MQNGNICPMNPSWDDFIYKMEKEITKKKDNEMEDLIFRTEYIMRYVERGDIFLDPPSLNLRNLFLMRYCTQGRALESHTENIERMFEMDILDFASWCDIAETEQQELADQEENIGYFNRTFADLAVMLLVFARRFPGRFNWSSEGVTDYILEIMLDYYTNDWISGKNIYKNTLHCLLRNPAKNK